MGLKIRRILSILTGVSLIVLGFAVNKYLSNKKKSRAVPVNQSSKLVFVDTVFNKSINLNIKGSGRIQAKNKIDLFTEVNGLFLGASREFKPGTKFNKGDLLLKIDDTEIKALLFAEKSRFQKGLAGVMPDIKIDYPTVYQKWDDYLHSIEIDKPIPPLPKVKDKKEKFFISTREIYSMFYNIKNLEARHAKYKIYAPFSGVLVEANVTENTLIRPGQKLGEYIDNSIFELEVSINYESIKRVNIGDFVEILSTSGTKIYKGKIIRVNDRIDMSTQTVSVYIQVYGSGLKDGQYMETNIKAGSIDQAIEIPRKLLSKDNSVYIVKNDTLLETVYVEPIVYNEKTVVVKGLKEGSLYVSKPIIGAYNGMKIEIIR